MVEKYIIGIDLGATNVRVALANKEGKILNKIIEKTEKEKGAEAISKQIIRLIYSLINSIKKEDIMGIGIGSIGPLDLKRGGLLKTPNIPQYDFIPLVEPIKEEFKINVELLNDCNAAVLGEKIFGAGKNIDNLVYVTFSTGIGGGAIVDGKLLLGKDGNAAEVGHITIDYEGKLKCGCGKRGHWEAYCSGANIPNFIKLFLEKISEEEKKKSLLMKYSNYNIDNVSAKMLYEAAKEKDEISIKIVEEIGRLNAIGIANLINVYDPSLITIGGAIALKNKELVINPIKKYVGNYAVNRLPEIIITPLGDDIVLYGTIAAILNKYCQNNPLL